MKLFRHLSVNEELLEPFPFKRELSMEAYLIENEDVLAIGDLRDVSIIQEEVTLKKDNSNSVDGRIDILATYANEYIAIIELKLGELNESHLNQLKRYLEKKKQIISKYPDIIDGNNDNIKWIGILVGSSISTDLAKKINDGCQEHEAQIAALTIQRYKSTNGGTYITTDTFFNNQSLSKDVTKYKFNGETYGKGRLVLAVLKQYVQDNPEIIYTDLEQRFPDNLQGSKGVFKTCHDANKIFEESSYKRHFLKPEELIKIGSDETIAVSNQWGVNNIDNFINCATKLGYKIEKVN